MATRRSRQTARSEQITPARTRPRIDHVEPQAQSASRDRLNPSECSGRARNATSRARSDPLYGAGRLRRPATAVPASERIGPSMARTRPAASPRHGSRRRRQNAALSPRSDPPDRPAVVLSSAMRDQFIALGVVPGARALRPWGIDHDSLSPGPVTAGTYALTLGEVAAATTWLMRAVGCRSAADAGAGYTCTRARKGGSDCEWPANVTVMSAVVSRPASLRGARFVVPPARPGYPAGITAALEAMGMERAASHALARPRRLSGRRRELPGRARRRRGLRDAMRAWLPIPAGAPLSKASPSKAGPTRRGTRRGPCRAGIESVAGRCPRGDSGAT
jgi:hypothetical protein